jgi:hypothetical protein
VARAGARVLYVGPFFSALDDIVAWGHRAGDIDKRPTARLLAPQHNLIYWSTRGREEPTQRSLSTPSWAMNA